MVVVAILVIPIFKVLILVFVEVGLMEYEQWLDKQPVVKS